MKKNVKRRKIRAKKSRWLTTGRSETLPNYCRQSAFSTRRHRYMNRPKKNSSCRINRNPENHHHVAGDHGFPIDYESSQSFISGFSQTTCLRCGIHNSAIGGLLMQCGICKKAYYCGMKCFNADLDEHQQYCASGAISFEPTKASPWDPTSHRKAPPALEAEKIESNLYRLVVKDKKNTAKVKAVDAEGNLFLGLQDGALFRYTKTGGSSRSNVCKLKSHGRVKELFGSGSLTITAVGEGGTVSIEVSPAIPEAPRLKVKLVDEDKQIFRIKLSDESGEKVVLKVVDSQGHVFRSLGPDSLFSYRASERPSEHTNEDIQVLYGDGRLVLTATNTNGLQSKAKVKPSRAPTPQLLIEELDNGLRRIITADDDGGDVKIEAVDGRGNHSLLLKPGNAFVYTDAGKECSRLTKVNDPVHGVVPRLSGHGPLQVKVTNKAGVSTEATVQPSEVDTPTLRIKIKKLRGGLRMLVADDKTGCPVTIAATDRKGASFVLEPGVVFQYTEAGDGPARQGQDCNENHKNIKKLYGHGKLKVVATNVAGRTAKVTVSPVDTEPPTLCVKKVCPGLFRIVAADSSGGPVGITATDTSGHNFSAHLDPDILFRYRDGPVKQSKENDSEHGRFIDLVGRGALTISARNSAGQTATSTMHPEAPPPPTLELEETVQSTNMAYREQVPRPLTKERADLLIMWYGRLGHPNQSKMRRLVATKLPPSCGITVADVDLLPWIIRGSILDTKRLYEIIANAGCETENDNDSVE